MKHLDWSRTVGIKEALKSLASCLFGLSELGEVGRNRSGADVVGQEGSDRVRKYEVAVGQALH